MTATARKSETGSPLLDDIMAQLKVMPAAKKKQLEKEVMAATGHLKFIPSPGPQTDAYMSRADILLYGGAAGGGKSALGLGLALNDHERSLIMRRRYSDVGALTEELIKFHGSREGFRGGTRPLLRMDAKRVIEFGAAANPGDEESWQGQAHDLLVYDEAVQFLESQIRFLMTWVRSSTPGQRCRTILASNPPVASQGQWIIGMFRPWLDITYSKPARPGELRWFVTDPDDRDMEVDGPEPVQFPGQDKPVIPKSRTFIQAFVKDNPYLVGTEYESTLDALRGEMRAAMRDGNFLAARRDQPDQLIPTDWVRAAMDRWKPQPPPDVPMCAMGVDVAQGGTDSTVISIRHDWWFSPLITVPGKMTPHGTDVAGLVIANRRDHCSVVIDMGGGYGGAAYEHLAGNGIEVIGYKGAEGSVKRTVDKQLGFYNRRAEAYWRFREALDPGQPNGSPIALPNDPELMAELTTPRYEIDIRGVKITTKEDVCDELGRSPDKADAVIMAWFGGIRGYDQMQQWSQDQGTRRRIGGLSGRTPRVIMDKPRR